MNPLLLVAILFLTVIVTGSVLVAVYDAMTGAPEEASSKRTKGENRYRSAPVVRMTRKATAG